MTKVTIEAKADAGSETVNVTLTIDGKAPSFKLQNIDHSPYLSTNVKTNSMASSTKEVWRFHTKRTHGDRTPYLTMYAEAILAENRRLFEKNPALDAVIVREVN